VRETSDDRLKTIDDGFTNFAMRYNEQTLPHEREFEFERKTFGQSWRKDHSSAHPSTATNGSTQFDGRNMSSGCAARSRPYV
jgi:hypothetical protein